jgi:hypothetical protein
METVLVEKELIGKTRIFPFPKNRVDHLCGLMVRVPGYKSRGFGLIPGATRFSEKSTQTREDN